MAPFLASIKVMGLPQIDDAILTATGERWTKVSMVIAKVEKAMSGDLPLGDERLQAISSHIEDLVRGGSLVAQGNVKNWRFSEIRRAGDDLKQDSRKAESEQGNIK